MSDAFFVNYVVNWNVLAFNSSRIRLNLFLDLAARDSDLNKFSFEIFHTSFGEVEESSLDIYRDGNLLNLSSVVLSTTEEDKVVVNVPFEPPLTAGSTSNFEFKFEVADGLCVEGEKVGVGGTWASIVTTEVEHIEYDFFAPSDSDVNFEPDIKEVIEFGDTNTSQNKLFIIYQKEDLGFQEEFPFKVFFSWDDQELSDSIKDELNACENFEFEIELTVEDVLWFFSVTFCCFAGVYLIMCKYPQAWGEENVVERVPHFRSDLILGPTTRGAATVNAVFEEDADDDFDNVVPVRTFEIEHGSP